MNEIVAKNLRAERARNNITQQQMARALGIGITAYNMKENCKADFKISELEKAATFLNVDFSTLVKGE